MSMPKNSNLITKILEHTGFNFVKEESLEDVTNKWEPVLAIMKYKIIDGKVIEKPMKRREIWMIKKHM